jgi:hypothetical protein
MIVIFFTGQLSLAQTPSKPKLTRAEQYAKLLGITDALMIGLKRVCKSDTCTALAAEGTALVAEARPKAAKNWFGYEQDLPTFHEQLTSVLTRMIAAIQANHYQKTNLPDCPTCQTAKIQTAAYLPDPELCQMCYDTFETLAEICALYLGICESCALICLATASLQFAHCIREFCP